MFSRTSGVLYHQFMEKMMMDREDLGYLWQHDAVFIYHPRISLVKDSVCPPIWIAKSHSCVIEIERLIEQKDLMTILEQNGLVTIGTEWVSDHWNKMSQWPLEQNESVTIGTKWVSDHWNRMSQWPLEQTESVTIGTEGVSHHGTGFFVDERVLFQLKEVCGIYQH